jgi:cobalt transporter subunit CbtB
MATTHSRTGIVSGTGQRISIAVVSLFLGAFFIYGTGLANSAVLHDTAHDVRHAYGFPCH